MCSRLGWSFWKISSGYFVAQAAYASCTLPFFASRLIAHHLRLYTWVISLVFCFYNVLRLLWPSFLPWSFPLFLFIFVARSAVWVLVRRIMFLVVVNYDWRFHHSSSSEETKTRIVVLAPLNVSSLRFCAISIWFIAFLLCLLVVTDSSRVVFASIYLCSDQPSF